jgi:hypothetical protein
MASLAASSASPVQASPLFVVGLPGITVFPDYLALDVFTTLTAFTVRVASPLP